MSIRKVRADHRGFRSHQRVKQVWAWLIDLIFPPMCGRCGRVDFRWCEACMDDLRAMPVTVKERSSQSMAGLCASGVYDGILKQAIRAFKYNGAVELAEPLGGRLATVLERRKWAFDIIIPVPLSAERLAERGYNQANLLSHQAAKQMNIPCRSDALRRIRDTKQQTGLDAWQRAENVKDAFAAAADLANQSILLIDDVVTTASTLEACADELRRAGARAVYAIAVASPATY